MSLMRVLFVLVWTSVLGKCEIRIICDVFHLRMMAREENLKCVSVPNARKIR